MLKKASFFLLILSAGIILSGCQSGNSADQASAASTDASSMTSQSLGQSSRMDPDPSVSSQSSQSTNNPNTPSMASIAAPDMAINQKKTYTAIMHTTAGDIEIALTDNATPITVNNFVTLAKKGFYDGTIFHRVIKGFMIQGGDPKGDGTGGPGYQFDDEPFTGEYTRGTIAMANAGPNTNGSQFFIMHANYPLPKNYVIFGHVTKGLETVDKIAEAPVQISSSGETSQPINPVGITSMEIIEK